jgi:hypothetical protein
MTEGDARRQGTCVSFDADVIKRLREEKERTGVPVSRLVNKLLREALQREGERP